MNIVLEVCPASDYELNESHRVIIDGKPMHSIGCLSECPEDACIGRSLVDGRDIINFIEMGYKAGKAGEPIKIEEREVEELS